MKIGVPKEIAPNERRVALTPDVAGRLTKGGFEIFIERGAGSAAFFPDEAYGAAGAKVSDRASVIGQSDIVLQVQAPVAAELAPYREGSALVAFFQPAAALLRQVKVPTREQIVQHMDGNLCRCGTYSHIVRAVERAAQQVGE